MNEVLDFIHRRWKVDARWCDGNCLWFALILKERFPSAEICYLPIPGHFVVKIGDVFYDWTGVVVPDGPVCPFEVIKQEDSLWYNRLIRNCFL